MFDRRKKASRVPLQLACEFAPRLSSLPSTAKPPSCHGHITLGLALCLDFPDDLEPAQRCVDAASASKNPHQDYVWRELQDQSARFAGRATNSTLREWSQGMVGNKSFQQVSEEFAAIVIPKVSRENRKVARGARRHLTKKFAVLRSRPAEKFSQCDNRVVARRK
jgi:hypothetical protein